MSGGARTAALTVVLLVATGAIGDDDRARSAGLATVFVESVESFGQPVSGLSSADSRRFAFGNRLFKTSWLEAPASVTTLDGLGPLYNRASCSGCHVRDGRGRPPSAPGEPLTSMLVRLGGSRAHTRYGVQLQDRAILGVSPEARVEIRYRERESHERDGGRVFLRHPVVRLLDPNYGRLGRTARPSLRVAPAIHGAGLLEAVDEATLLALADESDADGDGISGRPNRVFSAHLQRPSLGRFGWTAIEATLVDQIASALSLDIGITSRIRPATDATETQAFADRPNGGTPEISEEFLAHLAFYTSALAVPARRNVEDPRVRRGESLFSSIGCDRCHRPTLRTGKNAALPQLSDQLIHPYTDLLLHDMGAGLADGHRDQTAGGREWRTPPLWGLGLVRVVNGHTFFLHDGRARDLREAIHWHGGEARKASRAFRDLPPTDRDALIAFLESL